MNFRTHLWFSRLLACFIFVLIGVLSLVPGEERPHTGMPGQIEHFLAYFLTASFCGFQLRNSQSRALLGFSLCLYAGLLEILQIWIPGRNSQLIDFIASSAGVLTGLIAASVFMRGGNRAVKNR